MAHVFASNVSKFSSDIFSYKYQNCFCCLTAAIRLHTKLCEIWVKHIFVWVSCEWILATRLFINHPDSWWWFLFLDGVSGYPSAKRNWSDVMMELFHCKRWKYIVILPKDKDTFVKSYKKLRPITLMVLTKLQAVCVVRLLNLNLFCIMSQIWGDLLGQDVLVLVTFELKPDRMDVSCTRLYVN